MTNPRARCIGALALAIALSAPAAARARPGMHTFRLEGAGTPMVGSQIDRFDFGGGVGVGYELRFLPFLGVEARYAAFFFPAAQERADGETFGSYQGVGGAVRVHPLPDLDLGDLWLGAGGNAVFTGDVARFGLEVGVGFEFELAWFLRLGPFVRFAHVFQPPEDPLGPGDASFFELGLSIAGPGEEVPAAAGIADTDRDGLRDPDDRCPREPEDADGFEDHDGCPEADDDRDGIGDAEDGCANVPEDLDGDRDEDGCPEEAQDTDGDGVLDASDSCPSEAEDRDSFEDDDGCPDPDNDRDGMLDAADACPNEAELRNGFEDDDGCPDEAPAEAELRQLTARILFPHDRVRPTGGSMPVLRSVARLIEEHPEWERIRIEGHASDTGEADYNMQLSQRRAERIRDQLVRLGVDAARLEVHAHGATQPEVPGDTEEARALNRRVVFTVVQRGTAR